MIGYGAVTAAMMMKLRVARFNLRGYFSGLEGTSGSCSEEIKREGLWLYRLSVCMLRI